MERGNGDLVTREERNKNRGGYGRFVGGAGTSGSGGGSVRRPVQGGGGGLGVAPQERTREGSPLDLEEIGFVLRRPSSLAKRKVDAPNPRGAKVARIVDRSTGSGSGALPERTGGKGVRSSQSKGGLDLAIPDLESFEKGFSLTGAGVGGKGKGKVLAIEVGKTTSQKGGGDDLERNLVYVNPKSGKKHMVKKLDCSYKSTRIAACLLDGVVLDGDRRDLDGKELDKNLRVMDLAHCLLLAGYQKLKQMAQISESEKGELEKLKDKLVNVRDVQMAEKKELDELKRVHNDVILEIGLELMVLGHLKQFLNLFCHTWKSVELSSFDGNKKELGLVGFLLKNARAILKVTIRSSSTLSANPKKKIEVLKQLLMLPRVSTCVIDIY